MNDAVLVSGREYLKGLAVDYVPHMNGRSEKR